jgi:hypothetical protein
MFPADYFRGYQWDYKPPVDINVDGLTVRAWTERDDNSDAPDERDEGFWPSLDPKSAGYIGPKSKRTLRRHMARAHRVMEAWRNDEWDYCGVCVQVFCDGVPLTGQYEFAVWGVERNYPGDRSHSYLVELANESLSDALVSAKKRAAEMASKLTIVAEG